jgi:hypothetical protein
MSRRDRKIERHFVCQPALMVSVDGSRIGECSMLDVSAGGARLQITGGVSVPDEFILLLSKFGPGVRRRCAVAWRNETEVGIRFLLD